MATRVPTPGSEVICTILHNLDPVADVRESVAALDLSVGVNPLSVVLHDHAQAIPAFHKKDVCFVGVSMLHDVKEELAYQAKEKRFQDVVGDRTRAACADRHR
jgi:hypothetical protein